MGRLWARGGRLGTSRRGQVAPRAHVVRLLFRDVRDCGEASWGGAGVGRGGPPGWPGAFGAKKPGRKDTKRFGGLARDLVGRVVFVALTTQRGYHLNQWAGA